MAKRSESELGEYPFPSQHNPHQARRVVAKRENLAIPSLLMLSAVGVTWFATLGMLSPEQVKQWMSRTPEVSRATSEPFRVAVNKAQDAADLTQTAQFQEEWRTVSFLWAEAIALMKQVPETNHQYAIATEKVDEYSTYLAYAKSNIQESPNGAPINQQVWTEGATREFVLAVQGVPSEIEYHNSLCSETYHYGNSTVELRYGLVTGYQNRDNILNASPFVEDTAPLSTGSTGTSWSIGVTEADILAIQGTPTQVKRYESLDVTLFYYGSNLVKLVNGIVVEYINVSGALKVSVNSTVPGMGQMGVPSIGTAVTQPGTWSIGSSRADVFKVQGTPTQISREDGRCIEALHYGTSVVNLRNGIVEEYNNFGQNLRVTFTQPVAP